MDSRLCMNNYFNGTCSTINCQKFHLRRSATAETVIIDIHTNLYQHRATQRQFFPKGITVQVVNATDLPLKWAIPPEYHVDRDFYTQHNAIGFSWRHQELFEEVPDIIDDVITSMNAFINTHVYSAFTINISRYPDEAYMTPDVFFLQTILAQYRRYKIPSRTPIFIKAQEHSTGLHVLMDQHELMKTPIIWRDHNSSRNNLLTTMPSLVLKNHYFQVNSNSSAFALSEISTLIARGLVTQILPTSHHGEDITSDHNYQPHRMLQTLCNIHQAILASGLQQELFTTNEQLLENVYRIFPKKDTPKSYTGRPATILATNAAPMAKWFDSLAKNDPFAPRMYMPKLPLVTHNAKRSKFLTIESAKSCASNSSITRSKCPTIESAESTTTDYESAESSTTDSSSTLLRRSKCPTIESAESTTTDSSTTRTRRLKRPILKSSKSNTTHYESTTSTTTDSSTTRTRYPKRPLTESAESSRTDTSTTPTPAKRSKNEGTVVLRWTGEEATRIMEELLSQEDIFSWIRDMRQCMLDAGNTQTPVPQQQQQHWTTQLLNSLSASTASYMHLAIPISCNMVHAIALAIFLFFICFSTLLYIYL